jgi:hypothetical protein
MDVARSFMLPIPRSPSARDLGHPAFVIFHPFAEKREWMGTYFMLHAGICGAVMSIGGG